MLLELGCFQDEMCDGRQKHALNVTLAMFVPCQAASATEAMVLVPETPSCWTSTPFP